MRFRYSQWDEEEVKRILNLLGLMGLFNQLLLLTSGDIDRAFKILKMLQAKGLISAELDLEAFKSDIEKRNLIARDSSGGYSLTEKGERKLRQDFLHQIFSNLKKDLRGEHQTQQQGAGRELMPELRPYEFGDSMEEIDLGESIKETLKRGTEDIRLQEEDLRVHETHYHTSCATVLMVDISHSMILYGEDRITPAKKVALALAELILSEYSHDSLHCVLFGDDAHEVKVKDLPYITVGPYHTNTKAGLELAQKILLKKPHANKQIFMITDGKPSCITRGGELYKNPWGLDPEIVNKTLNEAGNCRKKGITISTFMIARDTYLVDFVERLTRANRGRAYFTSPEHLGEYLFFDYMNHRKKKIR
jgi:Ca-activated chloride channel homolog